MLPLPKEGFDLAETRSCLVDAKGCVKTNLNWYSAPLCKGTHTQVRALPSAIEVWHSGTRVAIHERSYERGKEVYNLEHYLDVLNRKPGALPGSRPLAQWRAQGLWPASFDRLWGLWQERLGNHGATRSMVDLLLLTREHGWPAVNKAAEAVLCLGCTDESAVKCLLTQSAAPNTIAKLTSEELGDLSRYDRPLPEITGYDRLLGGAK